MAVVVVNLLAVRRRGSHQWHSPVSYFSNNFPWVTLRFFSLEAFFQTVHITGVFYGLTLQMPSLQNRKGSFRNIKCFSPIYHASSTSRNDHFGRMEPVMDLGVATKCLASRSTRDDVDVFNVAQPRSQLLSVQ